MSNPRYYIDGRPAEILSIAPNGFMTVIYDDVQFKSTIQVGESHHFEPCDLSRPETQDEAARLRAAALGIKI